MTLPQLYVVLLAGGLVLLAGIAAARTASRLGLPSLLLFLGLGVLLGEDVLGVPFDDAQLAQTLGATALAVILVEGGLSTRWADVRRLLAPSALLATAGVVISVLVAAAGAHYLLGMNWQLALLLAAIVSSTDAAAVFAVMRSLPLPRKLASMVEAESGFNDAPTVILVLVFSTAGQMPGPLAIGGQMIYQIAAGAAIGLIVAMAGVVTLRYVALPASGLYPLASFGFGISAFAAAGAANASGIIAAYLSGIVLGNAVLPHRAATRSFAEGAGWLAQIGLFVMLGLLVDPSELLKALLPALVIGAFLLLVARPISVMACLVPFRVPWREQAFISWAGLRGAVLIVLTTFPIVAQVPGSLDVLHIVFVLVVVFTLIQGPTLPAVTRRLGLVRPEEAREVEIESAPLDVLGAELLTVTVPESSRLHGVEVAELRLPSPSVVSLVIRDESALVPSPDFRLQEGDQMLIVVTTRTRDEVERRLRAVGRRGRLARWHGERGDPDPGPDDRPRQNGGRGRWRSPRRRSQGPARSSTSGPGRDSPSRSSITTTADAR